MNTTIENLNPATKKGDKILLIKSNNSAKAYEGKIGEVVSNRSRASKHNFTCKFPNENISSGFSQVSIFYNGPADQFVLASREAQIEVKKEIIETKQKEIALLEEEIEFLEKYSSIEEYTAAKLSKLMEAHANTSDPEEKLKIMTEMLKKMKSTSLL